VKATAKITARIVATFFMISIFYIFLFFVFVLR